MNPNPRLTCVHLPHVDRAVGAAHHQIIVTRPPFDDLDGEEVSGGQHDALPLSQTQQADGVIAGHRTHTVLHTRLEEQRKPSPMTARREKAGLRGPEVVSDWLRMFH